MLDSIHLWPRIRSRLQLGPLGPHLDLYIAFLGAEGYTRDVIRRHIQAAESFGLWLTRNRQTASDVDEPTVLRFVASLHRTHPPSLPKQRGRLPGIAGGVRKIAQFLWQQGISHRQSEASALRPRDRFLHDYDQHLNQVRGLSPGTRRIYLHYAGKLMSDVFGAALPDWSLLTAERVVEFVQEQTGRLRASHCQLPMTAVRVMLRYLVAQGAIRVGLDAAVPTIRQWHLAALPRYLSAEQFESTLASCLGDSQIQRRNKAIMLLLGRLGLRAGEVVKLRLEDIDWRQGCILVRAGKTGRERVLPLPKRVGQALANYLQCRGPHGGERTVFLRIHPQNRPLTSTAISTLVRRALRLAGIVLPSMGAHTLRHTAATQMFQMGVPLKAIADVLGHACLETTAVYAKLDVQRLCQLALPWPQGAP